MKELTFRCPECGASVSLGDVECPRCTLYLGAETWEDYR